MCARVRRSGYIVILWSLTTLCSKVFSTIDSYCLYIKTVGPLQSAAVPLSTRIHLEIISVSIIYRLSIEYAQLEEHESRMLIYARLAVHMGRLEEIHSPIKRGVE